MTEGRVKRNFTPCLGERLSVAERLVADLHAQRSNGKNGPRGVIRCPDLVAAKRPVRLVPTHLKDAARIRSQKSERLSRGVRPEALRARLLQSADVDV